MEVKCHSEWEEMPSVATPEWDPVLVRSSNHTGDSSSHIRLPLALTVLSGQELWPPCSFLKPIPSLGSAHSRDTIDVCRTVCCLTQVWGPSQGLSLAGWGSRAVTLSPGGRSVLTSQVSLPPSHMATCSSSLAYR